MLVENKARCRPPLADDEVRAIAESIGRYQPEPEILRARRAPTHPPTPNPEEPVYHCLEDIPDLMTLDIAPAEPVVDGLLYSGSMTLLAGADGVAKTFLAQSLTLAVAGGAVFLGRRCRQTPVLYLDYENPGYAVKDRLQLLTGFPDEPQPLPGVKFWGTWLEQQPPQSGSPVLLDICRESKPLLIVDPLRYAHDADENDSGQMMLVMRTLRSYASAGATVLVQHHVAKQEGSTYRGSSALRGAFDCAYVMEDSEETDLLTLKCVKNRFGDKPTVYIKPDFDQGRFDVVDSPAWTKRQAELTRLHQIIEAEPGISVNRIIEMAGCKRTRVC